MRALMARERPPRHPFDLKLVPGGLVDLEFIAQSAQLVARARRSPRRRRPPPTVLAPAGRHRPGARGRAARRNPHHLFHRAAGDERRACRPVQGRRLDRRLPRTLLAQRTNDADLRSRLAEGNWIRGCRPRCVTPRRHVVPVAQAARAPERRSLLGVQEVLRASRGYGTLRGGPGPERAVDAARRAAWRVIPFRRDADGRRHL